MQNKKPLGRPNTLDTKNVSVTLPQEMIKKIDQLPAGRSETIRKALEAYLGKMTPYLDSLTAQHIYKLEEENKKLLDLLFKARTELEKRDYVADMIKEFQERISG